MTQPLWRPSPEAKKNTQLGQFWQHIETTHQVSLPLYRDLHAWSVSNKEDFWRAVVEQAGILYEGSLTPALEHHEKFQFNRWFPACKLNYAENLLWRRDDHPALISYNENATRTTYSYAELYEAAAAMANALIAAGVQPGDRVAAWLPNGPEAIIAALGTAWIGAVWSSCSPDFGYTGVMDRFGQISPTVLIVTDGYSYNGRWQDISERVATVQDALKVPFLIQVPGHQETDTIAGATLWQNWLMHDKPAPEFVRQSFTAPLSILYSSGTTGQPKCIMHGAGGTLLQHTKEHRLHGDLRQDDVLYYYTTCGWMMWNWLVGGLQTGATLVLYDGSPAYPDLGAQFKLAEETGVTHFGTSARFVQALEQNEFYPKQEADLSRLRVLYSTGSPLLDSSFDFLYAQVKEDLQVSSISGGTDIVSCFALGNPLLPVYKGSLQCIGLGMDVAVFDDEGQPLTSGQGELVCRQPFPSMPIGFWNDEDGSLYQAAYFDHFENIWAHGDFAEFIAHQEHDSLVIHGRADAVLNPGGVRIGTAEIYRQLTAIKDIKESVVVGQNWQGDVRVVLFVVLEKDVQLDEALLQHIRQSIRTGASPRHVPAVVIAVPDIPRTLSGKTVELAVRDVIHGREVKNQSALANPEALQYFRDLPALQE